MMWVQKSQKRKTPRATMKRMRIMVAIEDILFVVGLMVMNGMKE